MGVVVDAVHSGSAVIHGTGRYVLFVRLQTHSLRGVVIKSHGGADAYSFQHAIEIAHIEASQQVPRKIESHIEEYLNQDNMA